MVDEAIEDFKLMNPERFIDTTKEYDKVMADEKYSVASDCEEC